MAHSKHLHSLKIINLCFYLKKSNKTTLQMSASVSKLSKWKKDGSSPWHVYIIVINSGTASHQLTIWYIK